MQHNIIDLDEILLKQSFKIKTKDDNIFQKALNQASDYAKNNNAISVLSDMQANKSYIFHGKMSVTMGIAQSVCFQKINSIWEESIFSSIHPDDLIEKHQIEYNFFHFIKSIPEKYRADYQVIGVLRMFDTLGNLHFVQHRMRYISTYPENNFRYALCTYIFLPKNSNFDRISENKILIINTSNGEIIENKDNSPALFLSEREQEILRNIRKGKSSKEIADQLSISLHTVSRHRQNILAKLHAKNSLEACRIAEQLKLF